MQLVKYDMQFYYEKFPWNSVYLYQKDILKYIINVSKGNTFEKKVISRPGQSQDQTV